MNLKLFKIMTISQFVSDVFIGQFSDESYFKMLIKCLGYKYVLVCALDYLVWPINPVLGSLNTWEYC